MRRVFHVRVIKSFSESNKRKMSSRCGKGSRRTSVKWTSCVVPYAKLLLRMLLSLGGNLALNLLDAPCYLPCQGLVGVVKTGDGFHIANS